MVRRGQKLGRAAQTAGPMWKERDGGGGGRDFYASEEGVV
jgi:hypothetical protein